MASFWTIAVVDAHLRVNGVRRQPCQAKRGDTENAVAQNHFIADRSIPISHWIARAHDVAKLPQGA